MVVRIWGGVLMGIGAAWAGGCTVGNGMVETSLFSFQRKDDADWQVTVVKG